MLHVEKPVSQIPSVARQLNHPLYIISMLSSGRILEGSSRFHSRHIVCYDQFRSYHRQAMPICLML